MKNSQVFWKRIDTIKKLNSKISQITSSKPTLDEFTDYFNKQFSHHDRISNSDHRVIEEKVYEYAEFYI